MIYCDLDGVLADFESGVKKCTGKYPDQLNQGLMWGILGKQKDFYEKLDWTEDGEQLWNAIKEFNPIILTGCPRGKWAEPQKRKWCKEKLGEHIKVITCDTKRKPDYCMNPGDILIDDRLIIHLDWINKGGIFIHYKPNCTEQIINKIMESIKK